MHSILTNMLSNLTDDNILNKLGTINEKSQYDSLIIDSLSSNNLNSLNHLLSISQQEVIMNLLEFYPSISECFLKLDISHVPFPHYVLAAGYSSVQTMEALEKICQKLSFNYICFIPLYTPNSIFYHNQASLRCYLKCWCITLQYINIFYQKASDMPELSINCKDSTFSSAILRKWSLKIIPIHYQFELAIVHIIFFLYDIEKCSYQSDIQSDIERIYSYIGYARIFSLGIWFYNSTLDNIIQPDISENILIWLNSVSILQNAYSTLSNLKQCYSYYLLYTNNTLACFCESIYFKFIIIQISNTLKDEELTSFRDIIIKSYIDKKNYMLCNSALLILIGIVNYTLYILKGSDRNNISMGNRKPLSDILLLTFIEEGLSTSNFISLFESFPQYFRLEQTQMKMIYYTWALISNKPIISSFNSHWFYIIINLFSYFSNNKMYGQNVTLTHLKPMVNTVILNLLNNIKDINNDVIFQCYKFLQNNKSIREILREPPIANFAYFNFTDNDTISNSVHFTFNEYKTYTIACIFNSKYIECKIMYYIKHIEAIDTQSLIGYFNILNLLVMHCLYYIDQLEGQENSSFKFNLCKIIIKHMACSKAEGQLSQRYAQ